MIWSLWVTSKGDSPKGVWNEGFGRAVLLSWTRGHLYNNKGHMAVLEIVRFGYVIQVWYGWLQAYFYALGFECKVECTWWRCTQGSHYVSQDCGQLNLFDYHMAKFELHSWALESIYAIATFGCSVPYFALCEGYIGPCTILCRRCANGDAWLHRCRLGWQCHWLTIYQRIYVYTWECCYHLE